MSANKKVMSIAIKPDLHEELKRYSKRKGVSASTYIGLLIEQAVKLNIDDDAMVIGKPPEEDVIPIVLKLPAAFKNHPDRLKQWMEIQSSGIIKAMTKSLPTDKSEVVVESETDKDD
jgi:hypothetical protein